MSRSTLVWCYPLVGIVTGGLCAVINWRFAYRMGLVSSEIDGILLGAIAVTFEVCLWVAPNAATHHFRNRAFWKCRIAWCLWSLCALASFTSSVGYIATSREQAARVSIRDAAKFDQAGSSLSDLKTELGALTKRSAPRIQADLDKLVLEKRWPGEGSCQYAALDTQRVLCRTFVDLKTELTEARRADVLRSKIEAERDKVVDGKPSSSDPAASLLAYRTGVKLDDAQLIIALIMSSVSLALSSLGAFALTVDQPQAEHKSPDPEQPAVAVKITTREPVYVPASVQPAPTLQPEPVSKETDQVAPKLILPPKRW